MPNIYIKSHFVHRLLSADTQRETHRNDCYIWTTKLVGDKQERQWHCAAEDCEQLVHARDAWQSSKYTDNRRFHDDVRPIKRKNEDEDAAADAADKLTNTSGTM